MAIDLDWRKLDEELTARVLSGINTALASTKLPAFLGQITATDFSFGHIGPELELVEIRDVFEEFLHVDAEDDDALLEFAAMKQDGRRSSSPTRSLASGLSAGWSRPLGTPTPFSNPQASLWMSTSSSAPGYPFPRHPAFEPDRRSTASSSVYAGGRREPTPSLQTSSASSGVSVQLHFRIKYAGDMTLALQTSIKVNYPSPSFMNLPLSIRISALAFDGILAVAYEGDKKRLHISILDPDDGPKAAARGNKLLKDAVVESEVGQMDKLVLKDLENVERFVLSAARKALEDEIAWPNFQSFAWT